MAGRVTHRVFHGASARLTSGSPLWSGMSVAWKQVEAPGNSTRELRPYVGAKVRVPNSAHIHLYDLTRLEWRRITNTDEDTVSRAVRFRTRPSVRQSSSQYQAQSQDRIAA